jgi:hypothetical protein
MSEQQVPNKPQHAEGGRRISLDEAKERTALFKKRYLDITPGDREIISANLFSKGLILEVLKQPGCSGIRIYHSVNPHGTDPVTGAAGEVRELLLVGTDGNGEDLLRTTDYPSPGKNGKGCNLLGALIALPAYTEPKDAVLIADPAPCPQMCGGLTT